MDHHQEPGKAPDLPSTALRRGLVTTFLFTACLSLNLFLVPAYAEQAQLNDTVAGLLIGAPGLAGLLLVLPAGRLPNRWGFARVVQAATLLHLTGAGLLLASSFVINGSWGLPLAFLGQICFGGANAAFWPSMIGYYINIPERKQSEIQAVNTGVQGGGLMLGPLAAGSLVGLLGLVPAFAFYLVAAAAAVVGAYRLPVVAPPAGRDGDASLRSLWNEALALLEKYGALRLAAWSNVLTAVLWVAVGGSFFVLWGRNAGYAALAVGLMLTAREGAATVARFCFARLHHRLGTKRLLLAAPLGGGLSLLAVPWLAHHPVWLVGLIMVQGAALGLMAPAANQAVAEAAAPREVGPAMAVNVGMFNVGALCGPPLVGVAADLLGYAPAMSGVALAALVLLAVSTARDSELRNYALEASEDSPG